MTRGKAARNGCDFRALKSCQREGKKERDVSRCISKPQLSHMDGETLIGDLNMPGVRNNWHLVYIYFFCFVLLFFIVYRNAGEPIFTALPGRQTFMLLHPKTSEEILI